jgi:deoxyribodipyrimidine photo-lyase
LKTLFLFGRDLRLSDNEALHHAATTSTEWLPGYIFDEEFSKLSPIRQHSLLESLRSLDASLPGGLQVSAQAPEAALARLIDFGCERVVATRSFDPQGMLWQARIAEVLVQRGVRFELVGSNYAVTPGTIVKDDGEPLKVYTPFYKRWRAHGWPQPFTLNLSDTPWRAASEFVLPEASGPAPFEIRAGEAFAQQTWQRFRAKRLNSYGDNRNRTDLGGTSHLSHALAHGEIHPRTLLAELGEAASHDVFRKEIAWREFYADVLFRHPHTLTDYFQPRFAQMRYADPATDAELLAAWQQGKTGYPIVDAAMRQLNQSGWMHNRARMIVASFLVKDLHFEWQLGAAYFEERLTDFDPASNAHGWQWTAGCGTDASPYYRVFNPTLQGVKFDPHGDYVRRWVPELRHLAGSEVHEPWKLIDGLAAGYPAPIVDHAQERDEALRRLEELKTR